MLLKRSRTTVAAVHSIFRILLSSLLLLHRRIYHSERRTSVSKGSHKYAYCGRSAVNEESHIVQANSRNRILSMGPKMLYVTIGSDIRQLLTVVRCCACKERSGLISDYSTPSTCFKNGCDHRYCKSCEWMVESEFRTVHPTEILDETQHEYLNGVATSG